MIKVMMNGKKTIVTMLTLILVEFFCLKGEMTNFISLFPTKSYYYLKVVSLRNAVKL